MPACVQHRWIRHETLSHSVHGFLSKGQASLLAPTQRYAPMRVELFFLSPSGVETPAPTACLSEEVMLRRRSDCFFTWTWYTLGDGKGRYVSGSLYVQQEVRVPERCTATETLEALFDRTGQSDLKTRWCCGVMTSGRRILISSFICG
jgi:hypothetical protein